jgi:hypothetical protein
MRMIFMVQRYDFIRLRVEDIEVTNNNAQSSSVSKGDFFGANRKCWIFGLRSLLSGLLSLSTTQ